MGRIWKILTRKKVIDPVNVEETRLGRILNVFDLTALGVGSTLGVGVYVLAGQVAKVTAGPSVVLSFLIAAIASVFAGLCYAEFGARAPRAGSAYIYSYVCVGEFVAFVIGWNLILEYVIGSASVARGLSLYLDTLINNTLQDTFKEIAPIHVAYLASYFDFFSFGISILLAISLAFGLKESSKANNVITCLNIGVVLFIIIAGSIQADPANWRISPNNTNGTNSTIIGDGGFFPWGVEGMIKGAATCFYGFVGFDCIATTGEEVKNPRKAIPTSIVVSLFIIFLAYFGVATVLTLMVPYYLQDYNAPIPRAFEAVGWDWAKWIVAIGALFGLCASLFGAMFPLPRIIYAMGSDGLVFKFLAKVHPRFQSPVVGTLLAGILTGLMAALFDLSQLVNMMSIGTLQAYTIVAASVLLLRYNDDSIRQNFDGPTTSDQDELLSSESGTFSRSLKYIINCSVKQPNRITENIVAVEVLLYCILCIGIGLSVIYMGSPLLNGEIWAIVVTSVIVGLTVIVLVSLMTQPQSRKELSFKVPLVPLIPALSILVNIYLMLMLDYMTWVRFAVWMLIGCPMYFICACQHKPPAKSQNGGHYNANLTNGQSKLTNGISNSAFVHTETTENHSKRLSSKKKFAPPPPPTIFEQVEPIEVQHEAVIAQLDEILDKETAFAQLDDVLNNEMLNERKLSAGTLSNMSAVAPHLEDVVADVHCADVVTPVADPKRLSFPSIIPSLKPNPDHNLETPNEPAAEAEEETIEEEPSNIDDNEKSSILEVSENVSEIPVPPDMKHFDEMHENESETNTVAEESLNNLIPQEPSESVADPAIIQSPQPTEEMLKTVNLKHVQKQIKEIEPTDHVTASDDNLKVGTKEYKEFINLLNKRLQNTPAVPKFYTPPPKQVAIVEPKPILPNENVIDDNIDRKDAKEKLKFFYETRNARDNVVPSVQRKPILQGSKSVDEYLQSSRLEEEPKLPKTPLNSPRTEHRNKMVNVFDSIKLKKLDDHGLKRRLSKSVGSAFTKDDDKVSHKQKMADIFQSIEAMRRESLK